MERQGEKERERGRERIKEEVGDRQIVKESTIRNKERAAEQRTVSP